MKLYTLNEFVIAIYYLLIPEKGSFNESLEFFSKSEKKRYYQYRFSEKRIEFYFGRWLLKKVLSSFFNKEPKQIYFEENLYGKLYVCRKLNNNEGKKVYFNLSHAKNIVVCALTLDHEIGVDVEMVGKDITKSIHLWMSPCEIAYLDKHKKEERNIVAYRLWTMKEAFIKAKGKGFYMAPKFIDVLNTESMFCYSMNFKKKYYMAVAVETDEITAKKFCVQEFNMYDLFIKDYFSNGHKI